MSQQKSKLVTIIYEPVLNSNLIDLIQSLGAKGFTLTEVRGEGSANRHSGEIPDSKIKLEIICSAEIASKIMNQIAETYFADYSLITYSTDISVLRPEKF
jgi:nitrogen regulatory protein PII